MDTTDDDGGSGGRADWVYSMFPEIQKYGSPLPAKDHTQSKQIAQPRVVPATQGDLQRITYQGEVSPDRYEILGVYRTGEHSVIYRAMDREAGRIVAIKKHEHYMPKENRPADELIKESRAAEDRFRREVQILAKLNHPGIVEAYGFFFKEDDYKRKPFLVTELIEQPSLEEMLEQGGLFTEQDARQLILSGGAILDYLHTANGRPIIYRDLKPDNFKVMPKEAAWPHKLVDFSESKIGKATMSGSVVGTVGYNAPEIYGGGIADQSVDLYALARIAAHMAIGDSKKFMATWFGTTSLRQMKEEGDLNVSEQFLRAVERATARDPSHRYKILAELARDLGYNINSVPQTRQELEAILGHKSLPARVETKTQEVEKIGNNSLPAVINSGDGTLTLEFLPEVVDNGNGTLTIGEGYRDEKLKMHGYTIKIGDSPYQTLANLKEKVRGNYATIHKMQIPSVKRADVLSTLALAQYLAQQHPILQDALSGRRSLEDAVRVKGPSLTLLERLEPKYLFPGVKKSRFDRYEFDKQAYLAGRKELCRVFGVDETDFEFLNSNFLPYSLIGGISVPIGLGLILSQFIQKPFWDLKEALAHIAGGIILGGITGSNIKRYKANKKLANQAREMDSWIQEARISQQGDLEKKVESVELTIEEKRKINPVGMSMFTGIGTNLSIGFLVNFNLDWVIPASFATFGIGTTTYFSLSKYLTSRALKKKRLAAGLDEDGMREIGTIRIHDKEHKFKRLLRREGFRKKWFSKRTLTGEGINVQYQDWCNLDNNGESSGIYGYTTLNVSATDEQRIIAIYNLLVQNNLVKSMKLNSEQRPSPEPKQLSSRNTSAMADDAEFLD